MVGITSDVCMMEKQTKPIPIVFWTDEADKLREESNGEPIVMKLSDYRYTKECRLASINRGHEIKKVKG